MGYHTRHSKFPPWNRMRWWNTWCASFIVLVLSVFLKISKMINNTNKIWTQFSHPYLRSGMKNLLTIILCLILSRTMKLIYLIQVLLRRNYSTWSPENWTIFLTSLAWKINHSTSTTPTHNKVNNNFIPKTQAHKFPYRTFSLTWTNRREWDKWRCHWEFSIIINFKNSWEKTMVFVLNSRKQISNKVLRILRPKKFVILIFFNFS